VKMYDTWGRRERCRALLITMALLVALALLIVSLGHADASTSAGGRVVTEKATVTNFDTYPDGVRHYVAIRTVNGNVAGAITYRVFRPGQRVTVRGRLFGREIVSPRIW
jgi:hypothetical protein